MESTSDCVQQTPETVSLFSWLLLAVWFTTLCEMSDPFVSGAAALLTFSNDLIYWFHARAVKLHERGCDANHGELVRAWVAMRPVRMRSTCVRALSRHH